MSSPLNLVKKKGSEEWRPCGDYRRLNKVTMADQYQIPYVQDIFQKLSGCTILFSKIDLIRAYRQIHGAVEDTYKTAITTPFGLFEFTLLV